MQEHVRNVHPEHGIHKEMCERALHTETQVIVKREDEMAFAELNGSYLKFVEDDARLLYEQLVEDSRVKQVYDDFFIDDFDSLSYKIQ